MALTRYQGMEKGGNGGEREAEREVEREVEEWRAGMERREKWRGK